MSDTDPVEIGKRVVDSGCSEPPHNRVTQRLSEIDDGVAVVESFSHCWALQTEEGLVCVDASGPRTGSAVVKALRGWSKSQIHTLIYTHGHLDHVGGSGSFQSDADERGNKSIRVVAHENVTSRFRRYEQTNGWNLAINRRQFGGVRADLGLREEEVSFLPDDLVEPELTYRDVLELDVGGRQLELHHARGETDDHTWLWDPSRRAVFAGDFVIWLFPNAGNPQKVQRYPIEWAAALREMLAIGAEKVYPAHGLPIVGRRRVETVLGDIAEALEYLAESTLALMNEGATLDEIIHSVRVPDHLADRPWLAPQYDEPEFVVRNIYRQFGGWWDGNPSNLKPAREAVLAAEVVSLIGSVETVIDRAHSLSELGDIRLACHLVDIAVSAEPEHEGAHRVRAEIYWKRRLVEHSLMSKGVYAAAARESEKTLDKIADRISKRDETGRPVQG